MINGCSLSLSLKAMKIIQPCASTRKFKKAFDGRRESGVLPKAYNNY